MRAYASQVAGARDWLCSGLPCLDALLAGSDKQIMRKLKAVTEILLLELNLAPNPDPQLVSRLLGCLAAANQERALQRYFWRCPELDTLSRTCIGIMQEFGLLSADDPLHAAFLTWVDACYKERFPWRNLETEYIGRKFQQLPGSMAQLAQAGEFLGARLPRGLNDEYGLTHALFYISDFGQQTPDLPLDKPALRARIESLCAQALMSNNLDLLAEHLLTLRHMGLERAELAQWYAEQICACAQVDAAGHTYWLGPFDIQANLEKEEFAPTDWVFLENYHTTFLLRHFLLGLQAAPRRQYVPAPELALLRPAPAVAEVEQGLGALLRGQGDDRTVYALLQKEASATPTLLAWHQALRQARGRALPALPQSLACLRELQDLPLQYARSEVLLLQILLQTLICAYDDVRIGPENAAKLTQHYRQLTAGMPGRDGKALLLPAARLLLAAQAVADSNAEDLPPLLQVGVQGVLSMALRQRDVRATVMALSLHAWRASPPCAMDRQLAQAVCMASLQLLPSTAEAAAVELLWIELGLHLVQTWPASAS